MRSHTADTARAVVFAVLVHVAIVALFLVSMWWSSREEPLEAAGGMAADVIAVGELSAAMQQTLDAPAEEPVEPEPLPEPEPEPEPVQEPLPQPAPQDLLVEPDVIEQDEVVDAPTPVKATETVPQEAKRRQEQVDLTRPEPQRQQQAPSKPPVDESRLAAIRRLRAAQSREAQMAAERLRQLESLQARSGGSAAEESARSDAAASGAGDNTELQGRYIAALQQAIRGKWKRPPNQDRVAGMCRLVIRQVAGGGVLEAKTEEPCAYDEAARRSIEAAVLMAQPLPYEGFESVFRRELAIRFRDAE